MCITKLNQFFLVTRTFSHLEIPILQKQSFRTAFFLHPTFMNSSIHLRNLPTKALKKKKTQIMFDARHDI